MTLLTPSTAPDNSTDATFRVWGKSIADSLISMGLARSSDTGMINWSTVTKASVANTAQGYDIFIFQDALQGTYPVFIKLEYGGGSPVAYPSIWITVGTGSNGSGTLSGQLSTRFQLSGGSNPGTNYTSRFSGSTNRFMFNLWASGPVGANWVFVSVERTHDSTGSDTADGIMLMGGSPYGSYQTQYIPFSGVVPAARTVSRDWPVTVPLTGTGAVSSDIYIYPLRIWAYTYESSPSVNAFAYFDIDLTARVAANATCWDGQTHNIYPAGGTPFWGTNGGICYLAFRND